ncbi:MAG: 50S ribosomal protein L4 [Endomicrobium sp.]|nr:50S ribosomal protein L4 [Endomicrobium sp.]
MEIVVHDMNGIEKMKMDLPSLFSVKASVALLHEVVGAYLNNQRAGTHKTKTRGEVSFSGSKPWKQKGTGNARAGQRNSPLWRKGGIIFGPQPRDYYTKISKRKKKISLSMAFSVQFHNNAIIVVDSIKIDEIKTKKIVELIKNLKVENKKIIFLCNYDINLKIAARNIKNVIVEDIKNVNTYQILKADKLIMTPDSIKTLKMRQDKLIE